MEIVSSASEHFNRPRIIPEHFGRWLYVRLRTYLVLTVVTGLLCFVVTAPFYAEWRTLVVTLAAVSVIAVGYITPTWFNFFHRKKIRSEIVKLVSSAFSTGLPTSVMQSQIVASRPDYGEVIALIARLETNLRTAKELPHKRIVNDARGFQDQLAKAIEASDALCTIAIDFPDDRNIQLELAKGLVNAISLYGRAQRWDDMTHATHMLDLIAKHFPSDSDIQLERAKGWVSVLACLRAMQNS